MVAEKRLGGRAHAEAFLKFFFAAVRYPRNLGGKPFDMVLFFLKQTFGDKHRHHDVLMTECLETRVKVVAYVLPQRCAVGANNHTAAHAGI